MKHTFTLLCALAMASTAGAQTAETPLVRIGGSTYSLEEFDYVYQKNNAVAAEKLTRSQYLDLFVDYKLKVHEAMAQGLDTAASYLREAVNVGEGNTPVFYHDICVGFSKSSPSAGELEIAELTDNFAENILGYKQNENGIFSISPIEYPHHFALMFEETSTIGMRYRYILYNCICVPKNFDFNTVKDKKTIRTYKFDIFASKYKGKYIDFVSSEQPIFDNFFNEVVHL